MKGNAAKILPVHGARGDASVPPCNTGKPCRAAAGTLRHASVVDSLPTASLRPQMVGLLA